jgi:hypothetical protein
MMRPPGAVKDSQAKEIEVRSTIALSLDQFQSMHLPFRLALTELERERRTHRIIVPQ